VTYCIGILVDEGCCSHRIRAPMRASPASPPSARCSAGGPPFRAAHRRQSFTHRRRARHRHREVHKIDGGYLQQHDVDFSASFILAGQLKGGQLRLFLIYDAGNFIEAMGDTNYFQIGEVKYGKSILDRIVQRNTSLSDAAKCALISFDSTMRSNVSVGPPIDLLTGKSQA